MSLNSAGNVYIRSFGSGKKAESLGKFKSISATAVSPDGAYLALASRDGSIYIVSIATGKKIKTFMTKGSVEALTFSPDNRCLTSGSSTGRIQTNTISSGRERLTSAKDSGPVRSLTYFNDNRDFVSGSEDGTLRFWTHGGLECVKIIEAHAMPVLSLSPAYNGKFFI